MHEKRYSVFISSTYEDLKEERRAVQDTVISAGDFPVQMESFPASDDDAFALIQSLLDNCDYYILIIGGRYGSVPSEEGLSYTHKEFRYAIERKIPVLVMLHGMRGKISAERSEASDEGRRRLEAFIEEVSTGRTRKEWTTAGDLKAAVLAALTNAKQTKPRVGWVRGDAVASVDALEQLNEVRRENAKFRDALGNLEVEVPMIQLPEIDTEVQLDFLARQPRGAGRRGSNGTVRTTWMAAFPIVHSNLVWRTDEFTGEYWIDDDDSCAAIGSALAQEVSDDDTDGFFKLSKSTFRRLTSYFIEAGLMKPEGSQTPFPEIANKIARRHRLAEGDAPSFILTRGTAEVSFVGGFPARTDDIPF